MNFINVNDMVMALYDIMLMCIVGI